MYDQQRKSVTLVDDIMDKICIWAFWKIIWRKKSVGRTGIEEVVKFHQDNDPKHKARIVQEFLLYNCSKVLETFPQSPDLNPIENLRDKLD